MHKLFFNIFYAFLWVLTLLPLRILFVLSDLIFVILFWVVRYRREVVWNNLKNAFPEKTDKEKKRIERRFFRHLCDYFFETIKLMHISEKEITKRVSFNDSYLNAKIKEGKNIVIMSGHTANWEWLTAIPLQGDYHWAAPYHPLRNSPHFDKFMRDLRSRFGADPIPMKSTYKRLMEINRGGKPFVVGMIADQSPPIAKNRHWLTFMNQDTAIMEGSERIAEKTKATVVYCKMLKVKRGYYTIEIIPITDNVEEEDDLFVTKRYFELLEEHIKEQPEYWLWSHRRWKRKRPLNDKDIKK
jgi:KDO2-lipid IV(A) lauroyltransferase